MKRFALSDLEARVLLLAPTDTDASISRRILTEAGMDVLVVRQVGELCDEVKRGVGAILMTEDDVLGSGVDDLQSIIAEQPVWSDIPIVLLVQGGTSSPAAVFALEKLGNILLLEYPVQIATLVSTVRVALRDRRRQYETRRYQAELLQQAEALWRSNKELEQFAYVSSHDLKEPLRKILNYAELLESRFRNALGADGEKYIHMICDGANRMRNLIDSLLAFSRLTKTEHKQDRVNLGNTLSDVMNDLEITINDRGALVRIIPPLPTVEANALQMHQLFQNLIANAIKFNKGAQPEVTVSASQVADGWQVTVRDNGIGIEPQYADQIFNVFARLHGRTEYPGTGIGLAICKKIVEAHGGRIWVESALGQGAAFHLHFPKRIILAVEDKRAVAR